MSLHAFKLIDPDVVPIFGCYQEKVEPSRWAQEWRTTHDHRPLQGAAWTAVAR
jgi:hypothetical protein